MKQLLSILCCLPCFVMAQINAVTEEGYQIQVFDDGTWKYIDTTLNEKRFIKENKSVFQVPENSKFNVSSKVVNIKIMLDQDEWYFMPTPKSDVSEFTFNNKSEEIYGIVISEKAQIPLENLRNIALVNARDNVENLKLIEEEYRFVNNIKVLYLSFEGEVESMPLVYNNYYYSEEDGIVQFVTYAQKDIAANNKDLMFDLLNGFTKN